MRETLGKSAMDLLSKHVPLDFSLWAVFESKLYEIWASRRQRPSTITQLKTEIITAYKTLKSTCH